MSDNTIDCEAVSDLALAFLENELLPEERAQVERHQVGCPRCQVYLREAAGLASMLRSIEAPLPPPELREEILRAADQYFTEAATSASFLARCQQWLASWLSPDPSGISRLVVCRNCLTPACDGKCDDCLTFQTGVGATRRRTQVRTTLAFAVGILIATAAVKSPIVEPRPIPDPSPIFDPHAVARVIENVQRAHVRDSYGTAAYQNFTDGDYSTFSKGGVVKMAAQEVLAHEVIQEAIVALRQMPASERDVLTDRWRRLYRKTWDELGRISREGQTRAGSQAEREIAEASRSLLATATPPRSPGLS